MKNKKRFPKKKKSFWASLKLNFREMLKNKIQLYLWLAWLSFILILFFDFGTSIKWMFVFAFISSVPPLVVILNSVREYYERKKFNRYIMVGLIVLVFIGIIYAIIPVKFSILICLLFIIIMLAIRRNRKTHRPLTLPDLVDKKILFRRRIIRNFLLILPFIRL